MPIDHGRGRTVGHLTRLARHVALAGVVVCSSTAIARAADTTGSSSSVYDKFLEVIGLKGTGDPNIQYGERSPLVVPPTRDLPPPSVDAPPPVANWPTDPDLTRQRRARVQEKVGPHPDYVVEMAQPLRPSELNVPGTRPSRGSTQPDYGASADPEHVAPSKGSLFSFDWFKKEQYATFTGEPARSKLTDPPPGYLTPSADQPYGIGPAQAKAYKPQTVGERMEMPR